MRWLWYKLHTFLNTSEKKKTFQPLSPVRWSFSLRNTFGVWATPHFLHLFWQTQQKPPLHHTEWVKPWGIHGWGGNEIEYCCGCSSVCFMLLWATTAVTATASSSSSAHTLTFSTHYFTSNDNVFGGHHKAATLHQSPWLSQPAL